MARAIRGSLTMLPVAVFVALAFLSIASEAPSQEQMQAEYVGSELCQECHADQWDSFVEGIHYSEDLDLESMEGTAGCESCHGPGSTHVEMAGTEEPGFREAIIGFNKESARKQSSQCLDCHAAMEEQQHFGTSDHLTADVACAECHNPHQPVAVHAALKQAEPTLCYTCHGDKRSQFSLTEGHPVEEGFMVCSDCHSPHGTTNPTQLVAAENAVCADCHADKVGPWVFQHASVETDGCIGCHQPHGSVNPHMLQYRERRFVCFQCHTSQPGFHVQPGFSECNACHTQIHGSNLDPFFLR